MSLIGALTKAAKAGETVKKTAPFYSAVDEALANIARPKGTGAEFYTELTKQAGVKKAELADRKLEQAFKAKGKMTKEEAQQVLTDNPPPKLKEKVYDESTAIDEDELREIVSQEMFGKPYSQIRFGSPQHRQISDEVYTRMDMDNGTTYGQYKTPNGENYREILLKLPDEKQRFWAKNGQGVERIFNNPDEASRFAGSNGDARAMDSQTVERMRNEYQSSHWKDDSNVLAHMRVQDRKGANGEKILHVEEIQSDWHQAGRKKGYKPDDYIEQSNALEKEFKDLLTKRTELQNQAVTAKYIGGGEGAQALTDEANSMTPKLMKLQEQRDNLQNVINYGVPDAPFKKNWHELAMKRLLNYAADNGYDSIAITPGAEQAKRFSLSKQIDALEWNPENGRLYAKQKNKNDFAKIADDVTPDNLADYIGKEAAERLIAQPNAGSYKQLNGVDLEVGGEGMKGFYDKILPDYLNTFGKPYGAQVGQIQAPIKHELEGLRRMAGMAEEPPLTLHNFPITPEMRESIKQKGLPLYQQVGIPTAGAGAASQMPEEPEYGVGGAINSLAKTEALAKLAKLREQMAPRAEAVKNLIAKDQNSYLRDVVPNSLTNPEIEAEIARLKAKAEASKPEVKEAKGGVVRMTKNRDTMFMELSNKKLKRK